MTLEFDFAKEDRALQRRTLLTPSVKARLEMMPEVASLAELRDNVWQVSEGRAQHLLRSLVAAGEVVRLDRGVFSRVGTVEAARLPEVAPRAPVPSLGKAEGGEWPKTRRQIAGEMGYPGAASFAPVFAQLLLNGVIYRADSSGSHPLYAKGPEQGDAQLPPAALQVLKRIDPERVYSAGELAHAMGVAGQGWLPELVAAGEVHRVGRERYTRRLDNVVDELELQGREPTELYAQRMAAVAWPCTLGQAMSAWGLTRVATFSYMKQLILRGAVVRRGENHYDISLA